MALTSVDVCKLALSHLGNAGAITNIESPTTPEEIFCARFYDIARKEVFGYPFKFAVRKAALVARTDTDLNLNGEWAFAYEYPDCAEGCTNRVLRVIPVGAPHNYPSEDFTLYTALSDASDVVNLILTDLDQAYADYVVALDDVSLWDDSVTLAVSYRLASFLAPPIVKGKTGVALAASMMAMYKSALAIAQMSDAQQEQISELYKTHKPIWIRNR